MPRSPHLLVLLLLALAPLAPRVAAQEACGAQGSGTFCRFDGRACFYDAYTQDPSSSASTPPVA